MTEWLKLQNSCWFVCETYWLQLPMKNEVITDVTINEHKLDVTLHQTTIFAKAKHLL